MNKGTKVYCIREAIHIGNISGLRVLKNIEGNIYKILDIDDSDNTIFISSEFGGGSWYDMTNSNYNPYTGGKSDMYNYCDYFMSIAEWRDKQINSILNGE